MVIGKEAEDASIQLIQRGYKTDTESMTKVYKDGHHDCN